MELTIEQALQQAVEAHMAGKLQDAEALYQAILQAQPKHPDANHNLGVLAVSFNKPELALPLFKTALEANSQQVQFWISYVDALIKTNQLEIAKSVLEQGRKLELVGEGADALEAQLTAISELEKSESILQKQALSLTQERKKVSEKKEKKKNSSSNQTNPNQVRSPSQMEVSSLLEHFQKGRYDLAENLAKKLTQQYPNHQFSWKVLGAVYGQTGKLKESLIANQRTVAISPNDAEANYNLSVTLQQLGRLEDAEISYKKAIAIKPEYAEAYSNLGNTLKELGRLEDAVASYSQALAIKPEYAEAHSNLGNTLKELGRLEDAEISYKKAIALKPDLTEAHSNLGNTLKELGRLEDAVASYSQALAIKPEYAESLSNLGATLQELGRLEEAATSYKKAIAIKPQYAEKLSHEIASIRGLNPARATDAYVSALFDDYAKNFESSLIGKLNYKAPTIIADLLRPLISSINLHFDILDLGCGTGLVGEALIDLAKTLVGIDLSKEMLKIAQAKNIYHRLIQDEIHHALSLEQGASFDLVVSSDVFIYIGDIKAIFNQVYDVLKVGGFFAYSTEALYPADHGKEEVLPDYKLDLNGRYSHSSKYLLGLIDAKKFILKVIEVVQIRFEKGQPVMGYVVILQKQT
jgi:predicted TPR repeat methyltransferase